MKKFSRETQRALIKGCEPSSREVGKAVPSMCGSSVNPCSKQIEYSVYSISAGWGKMSTLPLKFFTACAQLTHPVLPIFPERKCTVSMGVREWMAALGTVQFSEDNFFPFSPISFFWKEVTVYFLNKKHLSFCKKNTYFYLTCKGVLSTSMPVHMCVVPIEARARLFGRSP